MYNFYLILWFKSITFIVRSEYNALVMPLVQIVDFNKQTMCYGQIEYFKMYLSIKLYDDIIANLHSIALNYNA